MKKLTYGQIASEGVSSGKVYFTSKSALLHAQLGEKVILAKKYTTPEDSLAIQNSVGVFTEVGGITSHASICAREFNKPCIINCVGIEFKPKHLNTIDASINEGTMVKLDANTGNIYVEGGKQDVYK